jgi:hypothetical protein
MAKPITPDAAYEEKLKRIPPEMIEAVNQLIIEKIDSYRSCSIKQKEIVTRYLDLKNVSGEDRKKLHDEIFEKKYLDFEDIFTKNGWIVKYKSPYWDENYDEYFDFKQKK